MERSHSGTVRRRQGAGKRASPCRVPGSGAGDFSTSTTLPTRYLLYSTRLSRPTESRAWGEARGQSSTVGHATENRSGLRDYSLHSAVLAMQDPALRHDLFFRPSTYAHAPPAIRLLMP